MLTFKEEPLKEVEAELRGLLKAHWEEVALNRDAIPLDPNWEEYYEIERLGMLSVLTVRDEGSLIGYYITFIKYHIHYKTTLCAFSDIFFLLKPYRSGRTALRLFREHEKAMKAHGVRQIITRHKLHVNDIGNLLEFDGHEQIEATYSKLLGD